MHLLPQFCSTMPMHLRVRLCALLALCIVPPLLCWLPGRSCAHISMCVISSLLYRLPDSYCAHISMCLVSPLLCLLSVSYCACASMCSGLFSFILIIRLGVSSRAHVARDSLMLSTIQTTVCVVGFVPISPAGPRVSCIYN